jgi:hypothetical protein
MKKPAKKKAKPAPKIEDLDLDPDAWPQFEGLVKSLAKPHIKPSVPSSKARLRRGSATKPTD